jgi:hypothetical protein
MGGEHKPIGAISEKDGFQKGGVLVSLRATLTRLCLSLALVGGQWCWRSSPPTEGSLTNQS